MITRPPFHHRYSAAVFAAVTMLFGCHADAQTTYYWDSNGATAGFGNSTGTWDTSGFWSTDGNGTSAPSNSTLTTSDTVNFGTATWNYGNSSISGPAAAQGFLNMNFGAGQTTALTLSGGTLNLAANSTITQISTSATMTIASVLQGSGSVLTKTGPGALTLSGNNTFTGGVTLTGNGALNLAHSKAVGPGAILLKSTQTSFPTTLGLSGGITVANPIQIDSTTGRESISSSGTGDNALTGGITITGSNSSNTMVFQNTQTSGNFTLSGGISAPSFAGYISFRGSLAGAVGFFNGVINAPSVAIDSNSATIWTFNTAGSNYPNFIIRSFGNVRLGVDNAIATKSYVSWGNNTITGALDLNGFNQSVAGLSANFAANGNNTVTNNGTSDSILTLAGLTGNYTFAGVFKDGATNKVSLVMNSAGRIQTLTGNNTHTGTTSVFGGKLVLGTPLALQNSPFDTSGSQNAGANLDITAATVNGTLTLGGLSGAINLALTNITGFQSVTNLRLNPQFGRSCTYAGAIADGMTARSVTKTGAGTQVLSGNNTYTGATTVSEGTLLIDGSTSSSSSVTVASGGTLGGCGTVGGPVTVSGTLAPTPGGMLRFTAPLTLQASGRMVIRVARSGNSFAYGQIASSAPIPLAGTLVIEDSGTDFLQAGDTIRIFDPATQTTGSFERVVLPSGYSFDSSKLAQGLLSVTQGPVKPEFTRFSIQAGTATLSWPEEFRGWWLQLNTNGLDPSGWLDLESSDSSNSITFALDPSAKSEFYRLRAPRAGDMAFAADPLARGDSLTIASVWSGVSPGFSFLTTQDQQIAAYYDANRELIVAARNSNAETFTTQALGEIFNGWDHHNYISAAIDSEGFLHLAADMHNDPMNYFRSSAPVTDAAQFATPGFMQRISPMWSGSTLARCTYPRWFESPSGEFCFNYRDKSVEPNLSVILRFDSATKTWSQTTGSNPLFRWNDGSSGYNYSVYHLRTRAGSLIHFYYLWTQDNANNYRLGYVRSADMVNWTDAFDRPVTLPIRPNAPLQTVVDDIPLNGGLHNSNPRLTFDRQGNPIIAYHKYDANGLSQIYVAKPDPATQAWKVVQLTNSTVRWDLVTAGSASNSFLDDDPLDGLVTLQISLVGSDGTAYPGNGYYTLDENTLENLPGTFPNAWSYAAANAPQSQSSRVDPSTPESSYVAPVSNATMQIPRLASAGLPLSDQQYYLRWESLPIANDKPRTDALGNVISPPPSTLRLYRTWSDFGNTAAGASSYGLLFKPHEARRFGSMTLGLDRQAPFRYTLSSSQTGAPHLAEWKFQVPAAGDYALGGFTRLPKPPQAPVRDSSLRLQLDASDATTLLLDSTGKVLRWADANRSTNFAEQTTATSRPLKTIDPVLGLPVIDFGPLVTNTANGSWLQFKNVAGAALNLSTIRTVIAVMRGSNFLLGDDNNIHFHRGIKPALTPTNPLWHASFTSANIRNGQTFLDGTLINGLTTAMPDSFWLVSVITAGNVEASNLARDRSQNYNVGGLQVAEMLIYDRPLSEAERLATESYLRKKWLSGLSSGTQQGFLLQIDETPPVLLPALSYWDYQSAREQDTGGMVRFPLSSGQHTLRVIANAPGAQLGYLWVNRAADTKIPSLGPVANSGFDLVTDPTAVCGYSLRSAVGSNPSGFSASYRIPVPAAGNYLLIGRTRAPSTNSNAFQLSIQGAAPEAWNLPVTGTQWAWAPVKTLSGLPAGPMTLTVSGGEAGSELDSFMLLKIP